MTKESDQIWHECRDLLRPYGRFKRIESPITPGIPDVNYTLLSPRGCQGWIELKLFEKIGKSPRHFTLDQLRWGQVEVKYGGNWYLLGRCGRVWLLYDIICAEKLYEGEGSFPILQSSQGFPIKEFLLHIAKQGGTSDRS